MESNPDATIESPASVLHVHAGQHEPVAVDSVRDPTDLGAIGIAVSRFCEQWSDERLAVRFDSLETLLRHTSPADVFGFVYLLLDRLSSVNAAAHVHFDPTRHDEPLPEATDEEVAELIAAWRDGTDERDVLEPAPSTEATDEEIAQVLGE